MTLAILKQVEELANPVPVTACAFFTSRTFISASGSISG